MQPIDLTNTDLSTDELLQQEQIAAEEKEINEEYKIWKKNSPFLYDTLVTHALEWPTLTTQWFPDVDAPENKDYVISRLLIGTHTSDKEQNYLQVASVQLPRSDLAADSRLYNEDQDEMGGYGGANCKIQINQRIPHDGEINRARYMPQKLDIIATKTVHGDVYLFDRTKFPLQPSANNLNCAPTIRLTGHSTEGYGLSWSCVTPGQLISSAEDALICHWDIQGATKEKSTIDPLRIYRGHVSTVGDVAWHKSQSSIFASVGDDCQLCLWDTRHQDDRKPVYSVKGAHSSEINTVDTSPYSEYLILTGGNDNLAKLWDIRNLGMGSVASFESHTGDVVNVQWHPTEASVFASGAADRRVMIWDLARIGDEQSPEDMADGPPELLFVHGGHTNRVADIAWNPAMPWMLASAAEDNIVQVWQIATAIYDVDMEDVPADLLE